MSKATLQLLIAFTLLFFIQTLKSQDKKSYFYDEFLNSVTKEKFDNYNHFDAIPIVIENDSTIIHKLITRRSFGYVSPSEKKTFYSAVENITDSKIDTTKMVIINYYLKKNSCLKHYSSDESYLKSIKRNNNIQQFFITSKNYKYRKKGVYIDTLNYFKEAFFKYETLCGNYLIMRPNGKFFRYLGEYHQDKIIDIAKSDWSKPSLKLFYNTKITVYHPSNNISHGKLDNTQKTQVLSLLDKISNSKINRKGKIVLHFFKNETSDLKSTIENKKYWKWVRKNTNAITSLVLIDKDLDIKTNPEKNIFKDEYDIVNRIFLKHSDYSTNHIILHQDGSFNIIYGKYDIIRILDSTN